MITDELVTEIKNRVQKHHELYSLPIKGEFWEEIFAKSILSIGGITDWEAKRTHTIGKDQTCSWSEFDNKRISNKSGVYTISSNKLKISGSRSTSHPTLEEKLNYYSDKQEDYYLCLATSSIKKDPNYYLFCFDTHILDYKNAEWVEQYDNENELMSWKCSTDSYDAWIKRDLSDQLWTHIKLNNTDIKPFVIER